MRFGATFLATGFLATGLGGVRFGAGRAAGFGGALTFPPREFEAVLELASTEAPALTRGPRYRTLPVDDAPLRRGLRPAPRSGIRPIVGVATRGTGTRWIADGGATRKDGKQRRSEIMVICCGGGGGGCERVCRNPEGGEAHAWDGWGRLGWRIAWADSCSRASSACHAGVNSIN